jgi:hypothetical protein
MKCGSIETTLFYNGEVDGTALQQTLAGLLERYPSFAGRPRLTGSPTAHVEGCTIVGGSGCGVPFVELEIEGSATTAAADPSLWRSRGGLANVPTIWQPDGAYDCTAPLMTVNLVRFTEGGTAVGIAINHGLVDGNGQAQVIRTLSMAHERGWDHLEVPELVVERPSCLLASSYTDLGGTDLAAPPDNDYFDFLRDIPSLLMKHARDNDLWQTVMRTTKENSYARIYVSREELQDIKRRDLAKSSTDALVARLTMSFLAAFPPEPDNCMQATFPRVIIDLRSPRCPLFPTNYLGNCVGMMIMESISCGDSLESTGQKIRRSLGLLRGGGQGQANAIASWAEYYCKSWAKSGTQPHLCPKSSELLSVDVDKVCAETKERQFLTFNIQQSFRRLDATFGAGACFDLFHQKLGGAHVLIEDAPGGVYIYLEGQSFPMHYKKNPAEWIASMESDEFRRLLLQ